MQKSNRKGHLTLIERNNSIRHASLCRSGSFFFWREKKKEPNTRKKKSAGFRTLRFAWVHYGTLCHTSQRLDNAALPLWIDIDVVRFWGANLPSCWAQRNIAITLLLCVILEMFRVSPSTWRAAKSFTTSKQARDFSLFVPKALFL